MQASRKSCTRMSPPCTLSYTRLAELRRWICGLLLSRLRERFVWSVATLGVSSPSLQYTLASARRESRFKTSERLGIAR